MTSPRGERIDALFEEARGLPAPRRETFLDDACAGDDALREEVESLLRFDTGMDDPLGNVIRREAESLFVGVEEGPLADGDRVGSYRVDRLLGRGGMGYVYLASRSDGAYDMTVAIKVARAGALTEAMASRFLVERRILATLDHAGIARLLDGGTLADGAPYLVMEHVEGERLDHYCRDRTPDLRARIELFLEICAAVSYAHRCLVIHRDLKPSNILVTPDGRPKLLDFGVASLLGSDERGAPRGSTHAVRGLTPEYASPEQLLGDPVTTEGDIYSLGVVLYELLTGARPRGFEGTDPSSLEAALEVTPEPPSGRLAGRVPGEVGRDLDAITARALAVDPTHRYRSVDDLASDVENALSRRPVSARAGGAFDRARRFVSRNRVGVTVGTLGVAAFATVIAVAGYRVAQERDVALDERDKATELKEFLEGLFEINDPDRSKGEEITARELLDHAAATLPTDTSERSETRIEMMYTIGSVYRKLGLHEESLNLIEAAIDLRAEIDGERESEKSLALIAERGLVLLASDRDEEARAIFEELLPRVEARDDAEAGWLGATLHNLASLVRADGEFERAEELFVRAVEVKTAAYGADDHRVGRSLRGLGRARHELGRLDEAETAYREAHAIALRSLGEDHSQTVNVLNDLASVAVDRGNYEDAEAYRRSIVDVRNRYLPEIHPERAASMFNLAMVLQRRGTFEEAAALLRDAIAIWIELQGPDGSDVDSGRLGLAHLLNAAGNPTAGAEIARESIASRERRYGENDFRVAFSLNVLEQSFSLLGRLDEAAAVQDRTLELLSGRFGSDHPAVGLMHANVSVTLRRLDRLTEARYHADEAARIASSARDRPWALAMISQGQIAARAGDTVEAHELLTRGVEHLVEIGGEEDGWMLDAKTWIATVARLGGDPAAARERVDALLPALEEKLPETRLDLARARIEGARSAEALDDLAAAERFARDAIEIYEDSAFDERAAEAWVVLGRTLAHGGRNAEAREAFERAIEIATTALADDHWRVSEARDALGKLDP